MYEDDGSESYAVPEGVTEIGDNAFFGARGLKKISFPASLKKRLCIFEGLILTTADFRRVNILKISLPVAGSTANSRQIERHEQPHHHRKYRQQ